MARRPLSRNLLAYLVLNLLAEAPMHPYEMKRLMHLRGKDQLVPVNPDSLYHSIAQLERAELIEAVETNREGRRPERTVYRATEAGRQTLHDWMAELLSEAHSNEHPRAIAALAHLPAMEPAEVRRHLEQRALMLEMQIASGEAALRVASERLPRVLVVEAEYARALKQAELDYVRALVADLASGELTWSTEDIARAAERARQAEDRPPMT
jgi:DNA-binding PadR family transcriptional regulator